MPKPTRPDASASKQGTLMSDKLSVIDLPFAGLKLVKQKRFEDNRGFFTELYNQADFKGLDLDVGFFQDNFSHSKANVLRGLHYQFDRPQLKFVSCIKGKVLDVVVDLRPTEPTYGQHFKCELSDENGTRLWIPAGFAHGFCVLGDQPAELLYKVNCQHNPKGELGLRWNDPDLKIDWPLKDPILSGKDQDATGFKEYQNSELSQRQWWL
jgi:dTDP-4-dehydrorhamnose 3,5-epimerase